MKRILHFGGLCAVVIISLSLTAQERKKDSLLSLLRSSGEDTAMFTILHRLYNLHRNSEPEASFSYGSQQLELAKKIKYKKGEGIAWQNIAVYWHLKGDFKNAWENYSKALQIKLAMKDSFGLGGLYNNLARFYQEQGEFKKALEQNYNSLRIKEALGDSSGISMSYVNLAILEGYLGNAEKGMEYYHRALSIQHVLKKKNNNVLSSAYNNIGLIHKDKGMLDSALFYFNLSYEIKKTMRDLLGIASSLSSLGSIHFMKKDYEKALSSLTQAISMQEELDDRGGLTIALIGCGNVHFKLQHYAKARQMYQRALELALRTGKKYQQIEAYDGLAQASDKLNDYKAAYQYHIFFSQMKDSLLNIEKSKQVTEMRVKYETEQKDKDIKLKDAQLLQNKAESRARDFQRNALIAGLCIAAAIVCFALWGYRAKRKAARLITLQKKEVEKQKELVETKQKEILDSIHYAKRIQKALITHKRYFEKHLKKLNSGKQ